MVKIHEIDDLSRIREKIEFPTRKFALGTPTIEENGQGNSKSLPKKGRGISYGY